MSRKKLENHNKPIGVSVPEDLLPSIDEMARAHGRTRSGLINFLLLNALGEYYGHNRPRLTHTILKTPTKP